MCPTATVSGSLNHVAESQFIGIDLFVLVCWENNTEEKTKWTFFCLSLHHLPL